MKFVVIFSIYLWSLLVPLNLTLKLTSVNIEQRWNSLSQMASYKNYEMAEKVMKRNVVKKPFLDDYLSTFELQREMATENHRIDKRTADPLDYIKFELADAKEPDDEVKQILQQYRMQQQKEIEELEKNKKLETITGTLKNDSNIEITSRSDDQDVNESQLIKFYQPVVPIPISIKSKKAIDNFPVPVQKAINLVLGENRNVARSLPPASQKYFNDKNLIASAVHNYKILAKQKDLSGNVGEPKEKLIFVPPSYYGYNQYVTPAPSHVGVSQPFINLISPHDRGDSEKLNDINSFIQPKHLVQITPAVNYLVPEAQNLKILPQAAEEAFKNYNYLLEPNQFQHNVFSKVSLLKQGRQIIDAGKDFSNINSDKNSQGDALGNYLQAASAKQNSPGIKNNDDAVSKYNALASLIGKPSGIQLNGLTNLLENELKSVGENKRPQDNRAPILFHPEGIQTPRPKNVFINRYGYKEVIPEGDKVDEFSGGNNFKPISEPKEEEQQVIHIKPQYKYITLNEGHDLFGLKTAYKGLAEDHDMQYASKYAFGYRVRDFHTGNDFGHKQNRDHDGTTHGQYHILLPDGRVQNVRYHADDSGFHADVSFESGH